MTDHALYSIGDAAQRTGLPVKTIRFYADRGIVPAAGHTATGYRLYDQAALARLDLVRSLRNLGLDLATITAVLRRGELLPDVAATHAHALASEIRVLRLRRAVLAKVADGELDPKQLSTLAQLSDDGRARVVDEFLAAVFGNLSDLDGIVRTLAPDLPDDPSVEQIEAWVELAELSRDAEFRASFRRVVECFADERARRDSPILQRDLAARLCDVVAPALAAGLDPASAEAATLVAGLGDADRLRSWLVDVADPRRERYLRLLAVINGWQVPESQASVFQWAARALRAG
ncbi:MerR family transcriptional regulator [Antrihabitans cavernicola]|uniref:MerR family transcriptional regulator n=1 Tax=Antrihabitans cavernicola TaxID=2495913 RepID=A0A5A7S5J8_9NOCA|nr:MerR family transcriptional regulator [Spelaeibacter cavernicola]KAA0019481.1 MerR family transcriptional regulator [Spelaeibacter cavernicola]